MRRLPRFVRHRSTMPPDRHPETSVVLGVYQGYVVHHTRGGRSMATNEIDWAQVEALHAEGLSHRQIAIKLGIARATFHDAVKRCCQINRRSCLMPTPPVILAA
jgi:hypothetical protein